MSKSKKQKQSTVNNAVHKSLFGEDTLFGHKVQRDRTKYKREQNNIIVKVNENENE
jgi:hypothetical protein